ncbi:MAG: lipid-A-disaccharide synthase N-terminal domain-containing protein [Planctomycetales bacterium]
MSGSEWIWLTIGASAQGLFTLRMLAQWWVSERAGQSVVPPAYWSMSLLGGVCMLAYACHRGDPVFIVGQVAGIAVYGRNLMLAGNSPGRELGRPLPEARLSTTLQNP